MGKIIVAGIVAYLVYTNFGVIQETLSTSTRDEVEKTVRSAAAVVDARPVQLSENPDAQREVDELRSARKGLVEDRVKAALKQLD